MSSEWDMQEHIIYEIYSHLHELITIQIHSLYWLSKSTIFNEIYDKKKLDSGHSVSVRCGFFIWYEPKRMNSAYW